MTLKFKMMSFSLPFSLESYIPNSITRKLSAESFSSQEEVTSTEDQEETTKHHLLAPVPRGQEKIRRLSMEFPESESPSLLTTDYPKEYSSSSVSTSVESLAVRRHSIAECEIQANSLSVPQNNFKNNIGPWSEPSSPKSTSARSSTNSLFLDVALLQENYSMESINSASNLINRRRTSFTELKPLGEQSTATSRFHKEVSPYKSVHGVQIGCSQTDVLTQTGKTSATINTKRGHARNDEMRLTITILIIILVFAVTWLPVVVINFIETFTDIKVHNAVTRVSMYTVYFQNVLNPVIYGWLNTSFRDAIKLLLRIPRRPR